MPTRAAHPCSAPGCPELVQVGSFCTSHAATSRSQREARPSSSQRGYGAYWQRLRKRYLLAHPICVDPYRLHVSQIIPATDVDHIVARSKGGTDSFSNLQALCHSCHSHKTATVDGGWGAAGRGS